MIYKFFDINELDQATTAKYYPILTEKKKKLIASLPDATERSKAFCSEILARQCLFELTDSPEFSFQLLLNINGKSAVGNFEADISLCGEDNLLCCAVSKFPLGAAIKKIEVCSFSQLQHYLTDRELRDVFSFSRFTYSDLIKAESLNEPMLCKRAAMYLVLKQSFFRAVGKVLKNNYLTVEFDITDDTAICSQENVVVSKLGYDEKNDCVFAISEVKNE